MPTKTWSVYTNGAQHKITLKHGYFSGKREIFIDGTLVHTSRQPVDYGSRHYFDLEGIQLELSILTNGITFTYYLIQEGVPQPTDAERQAGKTSTDLVHQAALVDLTFWQELARHLGLRYRAVDGAAWQQRHELFGMRQGYFTVVRAAFQAGSFKPGYRVTVRHEPLDTPEQVERLRADERIHSAHGNLKKSPNDLRSTEGFTQLFLPAQRGGTASDVAMRIQTFISAIFTHTRPLALETCENPDCPRLPDQQPEWTSINGIPRYLCAACFSSDTPWTESDELFIANTPRSLRAGLLVALATALLGAVVWAFIGFTFDLIASLTAFLILGAMLWLMRQVGTRMNFASILLAGLLTIFSVTLGQVLIFLMFVIRDGAPLSLLSFGYAASAILGDLSSLTDAYLMTALGAGSALFSQLKRAGRSGGVARPRGGLAGN